MGISVGQRTTKLQRRLLDIRVGPGAVQIPRAVRRVNLRFAQKAEGGHLGARKLWRNELIQLKYHNPFVAFTIDRNAQQNEQALLSVHFAKDETDLPTPSSSTSTQSQSKTTSSTDDASPTDKVVTIDVTGKMTEEIMAAFVKATDAVVLEPTQEDLALMEDMREQERKSLAARALSASVRAKAKREEQLLRQARGEDIS